MTPSAKTWNKVRALAPRPPPRRWRQDHSCPSIFASLLPKRPSRSASFLQRQYRMVLGWIVNLCQWGPEQMSHRTRYQNRRFWGRRPGGMSDVGYGRCVMITSPIERDSRLTLFRSCRQSEKREQNSPRKKRSTS